MRGFWASPRPLVPEAGPFTARDRVGCNSEVDTPQCGFSTINECDAAPEDAHVHSIQSIRFTTRPV